MDTTTTAYTPPSADPSPSVALVRRSPWDQVHELVHFLQDVDSLAAVLAKSTLLPPLMQHPANLKLVLMQGIEMGFTPIQAIRASYIVTSKDQPPRVGYYVESLVALVRSTGKCRFFVVEHADAELCRVRCARLDEPEDKVHVFELTMKAAQAANMDKRWVDGKPVVKYVWNTAPADMLRNRCCGRAVKTVFQDVVFGMATPDELDDIGAADALEARAAREFSPVPVTATAAPIVDAEIIEDAPAAEPAPAAPPPNAEGTGDHVWDAAMRALGQAVSVAMLGWTPDDLLVEFKRRAAATSTTKEMNTNLGPWIVGLKKLGEKSPPVLVECARIVEAFNARTAEIRKAGAK